MSLITCPYCGVEFQTRTEQSKHLQARGCKVIKRGYIADHKGLTEDHVRQLDEPPDPRHSEEERWFVIWEIIFPNTTRPLSAYIDGALSKDSIPPTALATLSWATCPEIDTTGQIAPPGANPRVTATLWEDEGSLCFQVEARGVCVARREDNRMINGTKLLNVAGMTRGRRDALLKSEKVRHVVKIGPMHLKGVWIPFERALDFANNEKITELLYPLFVHDIGQLLYHPTNQTRMNQVMMAAEKREQGVKSAGDQTQPLDTNLAFSTSPTSRHSNLVFGQESLYSGSHPEPLILPMAGTVSTIVNTPHGDTISSQITKTEHAQTTLGRPTNSSRSPETCKYLSTDSSSSEYEESSVGPKQALLHRLMDYFYSIFSNCPTTRPCFTSYGSGVIEQPHKTSHLATEISASGISPFEHSQKHSHKRRADEDDDDAGKDQRPPSKALKSNDHPDGGNPRFACPFFKKNPGKYQQRGACTGPGWATVHRIKEHIYRNHALPTTCPRCNEEFENDRLKNSHLRASEQCEMQDQIPAAEGMDPTQKELLRSRKRTHKYMTEADKWNEMYLILFPDANPTCLPSPYYEYLGSSLTVDGSPESEFSRYEQFLRRELPSHVQRQLELRIDERLNPIEESIRSELVDIIRDTQILLFNTYRSLRSATPQASGGEPVQDAGADAERVAHRDEESAQVEDDLRTFYQPPLMDNAGSFDDFNGLLFDFPEMPPGSIDLDSGYWSVAPASKDEKESDLLSGEFDFS
ncbi:hypothetical protein LZ30DRAFT_709833 [Colletotrichum cereale]|nr:hypothetical protein LZ30DRAFT_709833 [Colletotrichum cereale]